MNIVHVATELAPIAKVGGLGDVLYGLSKETQKAGHHVEIILPKYHCLDFNALKNLKVDSLDLISFEDSNSYKNTVLSAEFENLKILLIESHHPNHYFSRENIYGYPDDNDRFIYFSRTVLEYLYKAKKNPDVIHLHDWPTSLIAPLYKDMYIPRGMKVGGILLTIHNLEHQGKCLERNLNRIGLKGKAYLKPDKMQDPQNPELINLLKGGIEYADAVNTVSKTYAKEILTREGGFGLDSTLKKHEKKLSAILNGIDVAFWNPETDPHLISHFSSNQITQVLKGKAENRRQLRTHFGIKEIHAPLVTSITRLVKQKGPKLIAYGIEKTIEKGGQFILLGSSASPEDEALFKELQTTLAGNKNGAIFLERSESLAHLLFAGADMLFIPSLFEPCGLTQMIAQRYGTIPIVREVGGLADTVFDVEHSNVPENRRNGFTFSTPDYEGVNDGIDRAFALWQNDWEKWQTLMQNALAMDFSWKHTAPEYFALYKKLL